LICRRLEAAYSDRKILKTWQGANPSGRRRRSEAREASVSLAQFLFVHWFQLESRRCASPSGAYLQVPDVRHIARRITELSPEWRSRGVVCSRWRIQSIFEDWISCGYITSKQQRYKKPTGDWEGCPAVRTFTKKFFLELGGTNLWNKIQKQGARKLKRISGLISLAGMSLREYVSPGPCLSPRAAHRLGNKPWFFTQLDNSFKVRNSEPYKRYYTEIVISLGVRHMLEAAPPDKWSRAKVQAVARNVTNKQFGILQS